MLLSGAQKMMRSSLASISDSQWHFLQRFFVLSFDSGYFFRIHKIFDFRRNSSTSFIDFPRHSGIMTDAFCYIYSLLFKFSMISISSSKYQLPFSKYTGPSFDHL